jgi:hypothetical protein
LVEHDFGEDIVARETLAVYDAALQERPTQ